MEFHRNQPSLHRYSLLLSRPEDQCSVHTERSPEDKRLRPWWHRLNPTLTGKMLSYNKILQLFYRPLLRTLSRFARCPAQSRVGDCQTPLLSSLPEPSRSPPVLWLAHLRNCHQNLPGNMLPYKRCFPENTSILHKVLLWLSRADQNHREQYHHFPHHRHTSP